MKLLSFFSILPAEHLSALVFQVWKAAASSPLAALCELGADRVAVLPQDHWKHSHGEAAVRHVQELNSVCRSQWDSER